MSKSIIRIENLYKNYYVGDQTIEVLKWLDFEIGEWDFVSIMGHSGSGKSTLMNIIGMLDNPTSWYYHLGDIDVSEVTDDDQAMIRRANIGFVFQSYNLLKKTSSLMQVELPLMYQWVLKKEREERAREALIKVWLWDKLHSMPNELSGWQQQRISIARAMVTNPLIILADEPTGALDSKTWEEIMELFTELNKSWKTIVIITHEPEIDKFARTHIYLKDGNIVEGQPQKHNK
jgi:putative ABC transport system ATP-binding protein